MAGKSFREMKGRRKATRVGRREKSWEIFTEKKVPSLKIMQIVYTRKKAKQTFISLNFLLLLIIPFACPWDSPSCFAEGARRWKVLISSPSYSLFFGGGVTIAISLSRLAKNGECSVQTVFRCFQLKLAYRLCCLNNSAFGDDVMKAKTEEKSLKSFACLLFRNFHHAMSSTTVLRRRKWFFLIFRAAF